MSQYLYRLRQISGVVLTLVLLSVAAPAVVSAATSQTNISSAVTQSYNAEPGVQTGMIVKLDPKAPAAVEPLDAGSIGSLLGVVIPAANASIVLTPATTSQQQVLVATSGHYDVLVSNQNGPIKVGDYITISALSGIGMRANGDQVEVLGKAASAFSGASNVISSATLKSAPGSPTTVTIGLISVDVGIESNPLFVRTTDYVPGFLARVGSGVAGKPVNALRLYAGLAILLAAAFIAGSLLNSSVRGGMMAIGRNPLSRKSIIRSLIQAMFVGLVIFLSGVFGVYLLLKL